MLDDVSGNKYMRVVSQKGLGLDQEMQWLVKDMHAELKAWGHPGGTENKLVLKSDGEPAIKEVLEETRKERQRQLAEIEKIKVEVKEYRTADTIPENSEEGESQSNGGNTETHTDAKHAGED